MKPASGKPGAVQELLKHGIRLDMPFIQKLVSDEARAKENVNNLRTWIPSLRSCERSMLVF